MRPAHLMASGGLLLLACSCYGPGYQQPYGGYPAYPGQVQPGGTYYPGGTPGPSLGTPTFDSSQAPTSGSGFNNPTPGGDDRQVPNYGDPASNGNSPYFPNGSGAAGNSATTPDVAPLGFNLDEPATPIPAATPEPQPTEQPAANPFFDLGNDEQFEAPINGSPL